MCTVVGEVFARGYGGGSSQEPMGKGGADLAKSCSRKAPPARSRSSLIVGWPSSASVIRAESPYMQGGRCDWLEPPLIAQAEFFFAIFLPTLPARRAFGPQGRGHEVVGRVRVGVWV